jgi:hypothetical protein
MNIYEVMRTDGPSQEVEADFYERVGEDWVFFAADEEVFRLPLADVQAVVRIPNPPLAGEDDTTPFI